MHFVRHFFTLGLVLVALNGCGGDSTLNGKAVYQPTNPGGVNVPSEHEDFLSRVDIDRQICNHLSYTKEFIRPAMNHFNVKMKFQEIMDLVANPDQDTTPVDDVWSSTGQVDSRVIVEVSSVENPARKLVIEKTTEMSQTVDGMGWIAASGRFPLETDMLFEFDLNEMTGPRILMKISVVSGGAIINDWAGGSNYLGHECAAEFEYLRGTVVPGPLETEF